MNALQDTATIGLLVHGDNHFIVRGPLPEPTIALELVRQWSLIQIGAATPPHLSGWRIISRALRENLSWAVIVPGVGEISNPIYELVDELRARLVIHDLRE